MIRKACLHDAFQIAQVHVQSWRETYQNIVKEEILEQLDVDHKMSIWQIIVKDPDQTVLVYEEQDRIFGFADFYFTPNSEIGELKAIYLLKQIQGKGIGSLFMKQGFELFKRKGYKHIKVEVFDQNPSRYFYEKLGAFCVSEERADDYGEGLKVLNYQWNL